jgi:hypothetical protein
LSDSTTFNSLDREQSLPVGWLQRNMWQRHLVPEAWHELTLMLVLPSPSP